MIDDAGSVLRDAPGQIRIDLAVLRGEHPPPDGAPPEALLAVEVVTSPQAVVTFGVGRRNGMSVFRSYYRSGALVLVPGGNDPATERPVFVAAEPAAARVMASVIAVVMPKGDSLAGFEVDPDPASIDPVELMSTPIGSPEGVDGWLAVLGDESPRWFAAFRKKSPARISVCEPNRSTRSVSPSMLWGEITAMVFGQ